MTLRLPYQVKYDTQHLTIFLFNACPSYDVKIFTTWFIDFKMFLLIPPRKYISCQKLRLSKSIFSCANEHTYTLFRHISCRKYFQSLFMRDVQYVEYDAIVLNIIFLDIIIFKFKQRISCKMSKKRIPFWKNLQKIGLPMNVQLYRCWWRTRLIKHVKHYNINRGRPNTKSDQDL